MSVDGSAPRPLRADARRNRQRVLAAADAVFAEHGPTASTEEVARRAGVAVGTVFRHFPTKEVLIEAVLMDRLRRLGAEADALASADDPGAAFFDFLGRWAEESVTKHALADALAGGGVDLGAVQRAHPHDVERFHRAVELLLRRAQQAGAVRPDVDRAQLLALLVGTSRLAEHAAEDRQLRVATLAIIVDGLRARSQAAQSASS